MVLGRGELACLALLLLWISPVQAGEVSRGWSGLYVGGHAALGKVPLQGSAIDPEGFIGGGQVGFNVQSGRVVFGVEGDYSSGSIDDTLSINDAFVGPIKTSFEVDQVASVRGRLGFTAYDNVLLFGTAGYGWAEASASVSVPVFGIALSDSVDFDGLVYGGGVEYRFSELLSGRVEALRYDLAQEDDSSNDMNIDVIRIGLNLHLPVGSH